MTQINNTMADTLLKNCLGKTALTRLACSIQKADKSFPADEFIKTTNKQLKPLELKQRVVCIIKNMHEYLPDDFQRTAKILLTTKQHWDYGNKNEKYPEFAAWPLVDYFMYYGLEHPETSLHCLKELTELFSAEFSVRPFIEQHNSLAMAHINKWLNHDSEHVRRLASECTRPRLPWGKQLTDFINDPAPVIKLLERLKNDSSEYVRRSVANNLNDISKDHPDKVIKLGERWYKNATDDTRWIIKHALRTLIKQGHPDVFPLLGYTKNPAVNTSRIRLAKKTINLGEQLEFAFSIDSKSNTLQTLVLDYEIHHVKANGKTTAKVFKLKLLKLEGRATEKVIKTHSFQRITTRKYHAGQHRLVIKVNGRDYAATDFNLVIK